MSAVAAQEQDLLQGHLEQARRWCSDLVESAREIERRTKLRRSTPGRSVLPRVDSKLIRNVSRATARRASAIEETMNGLRLLHPEGRKEYLEGLVPSVSLAELLLAEAVDRDIYVASEPNEVVDWVDAAVAMSERLLRNREADPELRDLLVRSLCGRIETKLILSWSPGEVEDDLQRIEDLLHGQESPPEDPAVVLRLWRALGRYGLRISRPGASEFVDLALEVARAFGFCDEEILVELLAAEGEWIAGRPDRAAAQLELALKLREEIGGEPVSAWLVLLRHALTSAMAGDASAAFRSLEALEGEPMPPEGSLARREQRFRRLVVAYAQTDLGALEAAARDLSFPGDAWGHWWATLTRLERVRRLLVRSRKGRRWELSEHVAHILKATPPGVPRAAGALEALRSDLTEEKIDEAVRVLHELGPRGAWKDTEDDRE